VDRAAVSSTARLRLLTGFDDWNGSPVSNAYAQRFIAVTSRQPSDSQGKLMPMGSRKRVGAEAATGEETMLRGEAHKEASA
jgi:hypothetical protein